MHQPEFRWLNLRNTVPIQHTHNAITCRDRGCIKPKLSELRALQFRKNFRCERRTRYAFDFFLYTRERLRCDQDQLLASACFKPT